MNNIVLSKFGSFSAGGEIVKRKSDNANTLSMRNHAYVEYFIPADLTVERPPVILTHNYFTGAAWLGNADGNEGWAQFFLRHGFPVFIIDPPGTGRAGFNPDDIDKHQTVVEGAMSVDQGFWPGQDSSAWNAWNMGPEWGVAGDGIVQGNQMPTDEAAKIRLLATLIPNKPVEQSELDATLIDILQKINDMVGPSLFVGWSMAGGLGQRLVLQRPELIRGLVLLDGYSGENRFPTQDSWFDNGPIVKIDEVAKKLAEHQIPLLSINSASGHISNTGHSGKLNETLVEKVNSLKGYANSIWLPDVGIQGNGHMMFFERNSDQIAELVVNWIDNVVNH